MCDGEGGDIRGLWIPMTDNVNTKIWPKLGGFEDVQGGNREEEEETDRQGRWTIFVDGSEGGREVNCCCMGHWALPFLSCLTVLLLLTLLY